MIKMVNSGDECKLAAWCGCLDFIIVTPPPRPPPADGKHQITMGTAGPQPRAPDLSRTSSAICRSQWALPDLNRELQILVGSAHVREDVRINARWNGAIECQNRLNRCQIE